MDVEQQLLGLVDPAMADSSRLEGLRTCSKQATGLSQQTVAKVCETLIAWQKARHTPFWGTVDDKGFALELISILARNTGLDANLAAVTETLREIAIVGLPQSVAIEAFEQLCKIHGTTSWVVLPLMVECQEQETVAWYAQILGW